MKPRPTGVPPPAYIGEHMRDLTSYADVVKELTPEQASDFADELLEREAIMGEDASDAWRAAYERVCERHGINPRRSP